MSRGQQRVEISYTPGGVHERNTEVEGSTRESGEIKGVWRNQRKYWEINGSTGKSMEVLGNQWKYWEINGSTGKYTGEINGNMEIPREYQDCHHTNYNNKVLTSNCNTFY